MNNNELTKENLEIAKEEALETARDLHYDKQCIMDIEAAKSEGDIYRALLNARKRS